MAWCWPTRCCDAARRPGSSSPPAMPRTRWRAATPKAPVRRDQQALHPARPAQAGPSGAGRPDRRGLSGSGSLAVKQLRDEAPKGAFRWRDRSVSRLDAPGSRRVRCVRRGSIASSTRSDGLNGNPVKARPVRVHSGAAPQRSLETKPANSTGPRRKASGREAAGSRGCGPVPRRVQSPKTGPGRRTLIGLPLRPGTARGSGMGA